MPPLRRQTGGHTSADTRETPAVAVGWYVAQSGVRGCSTMREHSGGGRTTMHGLARKRAAARNTRRARTTRESPLSSLAGPTPSSEARSPSEPRKRSARLPARFNPVRARTATSERVPPRVDATETASDSTVAGSWLWGSCLMDARVVLPAPQGSERGQGGPADNRHSGADARRADRGATWEAEWGWSRRQG
jgi:hypothetical protein